MTDPGLAVRMADLLRRVLRAWGRDAPFGNPFSLLDECWRAIRQAEAVPPPPVVVSGRDLAELVCLAITPGGELDRRHGGSLADLRTAALSVLNPPEHEGDD